MAFDQLDPIGGYRGDIQAAMLAMIATKNPDAKLDDFIVVDPNPMTAEQREQYEIEKRKAELEASTARMALLFEQKTKKG